MPLKANRVYQEYKNWRSKHGFNGNGMSSIAFGRMFKSDVANYGGVVKSLYGHNVMYKFDVEKIHLYMSDNYYNN